MLICKQHGEGVGLSLPVPFVVGAGRSGTTLLRLMLDSNSRLAIPPETHFIPEAVAACAAASDRGAAFLHAVTSHERWGDFRLDRDVLKERVAALGPFDLGDALREFYLLYAQRFSKTRWGDKTPPYVTQMRLIKTLLPEASFIHLIRDGRDVVRSIKNLHFGPNSVAEGAKWWVERIEVARKQSAQLDAYLEVRYEDLVREPEPVLRRICRFIDLPWDPAMLCYHHRAGERLAEMHRNLSSPRATFSIIGHERVRIHARTREPLDASRIGQGSKEMSAAERRAFNQIAGPTLVALGYEISSDA